jgi:uncharacterized protein YdaT
VARIKEAEMPWSKGEAPSHTKKAKTDKQKRQWKDVANSSLKRGDSEAVAIRKANGVLKDPKTRASKGGKK